LNKEEYQNDLDKKGIHDSSNTENSQLAHTKVQKKKKGSENSLSRSA
jgi:hypothetical protein